MIEYHDIKPFGILYKPIPYNKRLSVDYRSLPKDFKEEIFRAKFKFDKEIITLLGNLCKASQNGMSLQMGRGHDVTPVKVVRLLNYLEKEVFITVWKGYYDTVRNKGYKSLYFPTKKLIEVFKYMVYKESMPPLIECTKKITCTKGEKKYKKIKKRAYRKNTQVLERERLIKEYNLFFDKNRFTCNTGKGQISFLPFISSIYSEDYTHGGRFYSRGKKCTINYQGLNKEERSTILCNGLPCVEFDFKGLHAHLLYASANLQFPPDKDPYAFLPAEDRSLAKFLFMLALNCDTDRSICYTFINAVKEAVKAKESQTVTDTEDLKEIEPFLRYFRANNGSYGHTPIKTMLKSLRGFYEPAKELLGHGYGRDLQYRDSCIMEEVLRECLKQGIPALPVHDSLIVPEKYAETIKPLMEEAYKKVTGFTCPVEQVKVNKTTSKKVA